jgi:hypothetical protein
MNKHNTLCQYFIAYLSRVSSDSIENMSWFGRSRNRGSPKRPDWFAGPANEYRTVLSKRIDRPGNEFKYPPPSRTNVKNGWVKLFLHTPTVSNNGEREEGNLTLYKNEWGVLNTSINGNLLTQRGKFLVNEETNRSLHIYTRQAMYVNRQHFRRVSATNVAVEKQ